MRRLAICLYGHCRTFELTYQNFFKFLADAPASALKTGIKKPRAASAARGRVTPGRAGAEEE